jgi:hypothetical protein
VLYKTLIFHRTSNKSLIFHVCNGQDINLYHIKDSTNLGIEMIQGYQKIPMENAGVHGGTSWLRVIEYF